VDSGCDESFTQSPPVLSECVEVYEEVPQQNCFNEAYIPYVQTEIGQEWVETDYNNSPVYTPNAPIQQQQHFITQVPPQIHDDTDKSYRDLMETSFINKIGKEQDLSESSFVDQAYQEPNLNEWYEDPIFAQDMQEEIAAIDNTDEYNGELYEMNTYDYFDLIEAFNC